MKNYKLLTPGPLTTSEAVKKEMLFDHCTWDNDYKEITQQIRRKLLHIANASENKYTCVLMQGSGTFGVESVLSSVIGKEDTLLIAANGAYGERMAQIAEHSGISYILYNEEYHKIIDCDKIDSLLKVHKEITHVSMVHCETTSGILNDIERVANIVKQNGRCFIVDAMSSFGGIDIPVEKWNIDFLISSANKCIQGVPGFCFILGKTNFIKDCKGKARSLSLDLYDQYETMEKDGKWRFTSPTHTVLAFHKAMEELEKEGGVAAREKRYRENNDYVRKTLEALGMKAYIGEEHQSPVITTFFYPENCKFSFEEMYDFIKERGYAIYPGKVTEADTFRIGNIGEIYLEDMIKLCEIIEEFLREKN